MPSFMDDMDVGMGNGKTNRRHSDFDVASMDLTLEYSQAKANLCTTKDKSTPLENKETKSSEELYKAITDKNRAIEILKRRLTNQQIQLGYYLHKNLATEAVLEFSSKCFPHLAEDSTQLSLAMYKFIRDTGGKTRLAQLREKLTDYNNRVHKALLRQEQLVRQGFGFDDAGDIRRNDEEVVDDGDPEMSDDFRYAKKYYKSAKLEMCSQLMSLTLQVRKELERFRLCAENVVKLEEERNALVDRVFSLPVEERYGNLHVSMVEHPKQDSSTSLRSTTSASTNTEGKPPTTSLGGALQDMESEAIQLLLLSEKQKNEFVIALEEARVENQQLRERLRDLEEAASDERVIQLQEKCNSIEREVDAMRKDLEAEQNEKEQIIKRMALEIDERDLSDKDLQSELKTLKSTVELLRNEKDSLQKKLDETTKHYIEQLNKITSTDDMLTTNSEPVSQQDVNDLTELVVRQEEQIKDLLSIMSEMNVKEDTSESSTSTKEGDVQSIEEAAPQKEEDSQDVDDQEYHIYYDSTSDFSNQDASEDGRIPPEESPANCDSKDTSREAKTEEPRIQIRRSRSPHLRERHREGLATTSLRVQAFDKDGKSESMHAVLECSSPVDGLLEMNNSSKLHLRLHCTSPQRTTNYIESPSSGNSSYPFCPEKHVSGDHVHSVVVDSNNEGRHLSRETKIYLTEQLNKIKSRLQTSKSSLTTRKEIVQNLNEIYSQLFGQDDEVMTQSTRT